MPNELDDLKEAVRIEISEGTAVIALLNGLKVKLDAAIASGDQAELIALSQQLGANAQAMAEAVIANTPAANP